MGSKSVLAPVFGHSWDLRGQWELQQGVEELSNLIHPLVLDMSVVCSAWCKPELNLLAEETRASHLLCFWQLS